ncbi:MAG: ABC transporter permease [Candidatus Omnitrophota bacterium]|nr:MAG: ABC transporter permease [Candidatus Omnitrophota bacterium]
MIELKNINKAYGSGKIKVQALRNVSLNIAPGEFIAIIGPSGSGKSTLLHVLGFLDRPDSGSYNLRGKETNRLSEDALAVLRNHLVGFVFQQFHLLPRITALENAELPLIYAGKRHLKEKAAEAIKEVGLGPRAAHRPNELSGGEQQRVAIARSLVNEPAIILADEPTGNLDTKTEEEIISILERLNQKGKTIIMVTHEKEIARHAKRIISMRDGEIVADERMGQEGEKPVASGTVSAIDKILSGSHFITGRAELLDHFRQAMGAIVSHKMRSFLSMLGILIGVGAVIAMLALGEGARESISLRLASLGSNLLTVRPGSHRFHGVALETGAVTRFTLQDADAIAKLLPVKDVSASVRGRAQLVYGNRNWNTQIQGTGADYATMRAAVPVVGRFFTEEELRVRQKVALLGTTVARELFGDINPVGSTVKINRINFQVIGILPEKGASHWRDQDDVVIIPVTTAMYRLLGKEYVDSIDVEVKDSGLMQEAQEAISELIIKRHRLDRESEDAFEIRNMAEIQETLESTTRTMTWLLGSIACISLLVGGIGIMNIMLVSVTERTREIGLRKAIGARRKDIMTQFLVEAIVMTAGGGIIGIIFGASIAMLLSVLAGWATKISPSSVILATTFSIAVGLGFGLWPAKQASRLNPIEALRYE